MGMLTKEDLNQIGELLVKNNVVLKDAIVTEVGEVIEQNLFPQFDKVNGRLDKVENRLEGVETRLDKVEGRLTGVETKLTKVDRKTDEMVVVLHEKHMFTAADITRIDAAQLYPRPTA